MTEEKEGKNSMDEGEEGKNLEEDEEGKDLLDEEEGKDLLDEEEGKDLVDEEEGQKDLMETELGMDFTNEKKGKSILDEAQGPDLMNEEEGTNSLDPARTDFMQPLDKDTWTSPATIEQYASQLTNSVFPLVFAEISYPDLLEDCGVVNPAFSAESTAAPSPSSPHQMTLQQGQLNDSTKEQVFPDFVTAERCLSDVLTDNFPHPPGASPRKPAKTPLSTKSSSDLLSQDSNSLRGMQFDLVSCTSVASFGRESTVAHADSTEFTIGRRANGTNEPAADLRMSTDFNDSDEEVEEETAGQAKVDVEQGTYQSAGSGVQWEEEGYPALLDIHQHDPNRIFSDEPGHFKDAPSSPRTATDDVEDRQTPSVSASGKDKVERDEGKVHSTTTSGPDSPDTESADEQPDLEVEPVDQVAGDPIHQSGGEGLEWENDTPVSPQKHVSEQWAASEDMAEERRWRTVVINGTKHQIDMTSVEPYRRVISHGGYYGEGLNAIAVFAACYLPSRSEPDYDYIMDNLFMYAVSMLDTLVAEDYVIIYFQGGSTSVQMPPFAWLRKCYRLIDRRHVSHTEIGLDRRMRKNLKGIYLVHPTLWLRTVVMMAKPFISSKFSKKVHFIQALNDLGKLVCMDQVEIPDEVLKHDHERVFSRSLPKVTNIDRPIDSTNEDRRTSSHSNASKSVVNDDIQH